MAGGQTNEMTPENIRDIQFKKGASFSAGFIRKFDREWREVREAARRIKERQSR